MFPVTELVDFHTGVCDTDVNRCSGDGRGANEMSSTQAALCCAISVNTSQLYMIYPQLFLLFHVILERNHSFVSSNTRSCRLMSYFGYGSRQGSLARNLVYPVDRNIVEAVGQMDCRIQFVRRRSLRGFAKS